MTTRKEILEQLAAGAIDVTQAAEMLNALSSSEEELPVPPLPPGPPPPQTARQEQSGPDRPTRGRWLRVHVTDLDSGRARVRVNVPLALVNIGLKLGARFTDELDKDLIDNLVATVRDESISGTLVEVEDLEDNERVEVFID